MTAPVYAGELQQHGVACLLLRKWSWLRRGNGARRVWSQKRRLQHRWHVPRLRQTLAAAYVRPQPRSHQLWLSAAELSLVPRQSRGLQLLSRSPTASVLR
eukprot:XP_001692851.1 predicted protein [Chlamydomonas reinhardtii]